MPKKIKEELHICDFCGEKCSSYRATSEGKWCIVCVTIPYQERIDALSKLIDKLKKPDQVFSKSPVDAGWRNRKLIRKDNPPQGEKEE